MVPGHNGWRVGFISLFLGVGLLCCVVSFAGESVTATVAPPLTNSFSFCFGSHAIQVDVSSPKDLHQLQEAIESELATESRDPLSPGPHSIEKRERRGLLEMHRLTQLLLECSETRQAETLKVLLLETAAASSNLNRKPLPERVDFFQTPWFFLERLSRPVGKGQTAASNLHPGSEQDLSRADPEPSTFWERPSSISGQDLYHGFGRDHLLLESQTLCSYAGPKEGYGRNPGFEIESAGRRLKLKFAEISSEPFAARIFDALGYHADPTDYVPGVQVRYSRKMLQEFNSRKPLKTHFTFLGFVPFFIMDLQQDYDPFQYIAEAVLTDGSIVSGTELKRRLLGHCDAPHPELQPANFRTNFEARIKYIKTVPASVQSKTGKSIGPWDFGELDHATRRELRGVGLLAAWLGWFDARSDNTRLRIIDKHGNKLAHYFSDLGGVLGQTSGILYARGEQPNAFPWTFTRPPLWQGPHHLARPLRLKGYKPVDITPAFAAMTLDDARWMARLIAALRPEQIQEALIASGFDSAQAQLYLTKLLNRRERMLEDLGLGKEAPVTAAAHESRHFSYDPVTDGALRVRVAGILVEAPVGDHRIVNGRLVTAPVRTESASKHRAQPAIAFSF